MTEYATEHGHSGRLDQHRSRIALWIAAAEGIVVAVSHDATKWTVLGLGVVATLLWFIGRNANSNFLRQALWIFAASQLIALLLVLLAVFFKWLLVIGLVICVVLGLAFLFLDRR